MTKKITDGQDKEDRFIIFRDGAKKKVTAKQAEELWTVSGKNGREKIQIDGDKIKFSDIARIIKASEYYQENPEERPKKTEEMKRMEKWKDTKKPEDIKKKNLAGLLAHIEKNEDSEAAKAKFKKKMKESDFEYKEIKKLKEELEDINEIRKFPGLGIMLVDNFKKLLKRNAVTKTENERWTVNCEYPKLVKKRDGVIVNRVDKGGTLGILESIKNSDKQDHEIKWFPREYHKYLAEKNGREDILEWFAGSEGKGEYQYSYFAI